MSTFLLVVSLVLLQLCLTVVDALNHFHAIHEPRGGHDIDKEVERNLLVIRRRIDSKRASDEEVKLKLQSIQRRIDSKKASDEEVKQKLQSIRRRVDSKRASDEEVKRKLQSIRRRLYAKRTPSSSDVVVNEIFAINVANSTTLKYTISHWYWEEDYTFIWGPLGSLII